MKPRKDLILLAFAATCLVAASCSDGIDSEIYVDPKYEPSESDKLTQEEIDAIVYHAQQFVSQANLPRLREQHRRIIRTQKPEIRISYGGEKYGKIELEWRISPTTVMILWTHGKLTVRRPQWRLEVRVTSAPDRSQSQRKMR